MVGYIERDEIVPMVAETYTLRDIHTAQASFMAKNTIGKIVLTVD
jgi:NADPH:quinone reductase-like Zn-dependent oxidoreductase